MVPQLAALVDASAAVVCACVAVMTWRRRAQSPTLAVALALVMAGSCWWSVANAVVAGTSDGTVAAIATLATYPGASAMVAACVCLGLAVAWPQWVPQRRLVVVLLIEPVLITLAAATNPWHLLVYRGAGAAQLTGPRGWTGGPAFWLDVWYCYLAVAIGIAVLAWAWWKGSPAFRGQRTALLLAGLVPAAAYGISLTGALGATVDQTPLSLAVAGAIMAYAIFRQDLFTFGPVARALIVDQIGDAVVVISPSGRVLDLNPAAAALARALDPDAPAKLVGALGHRIFGAALATADGGATDLVVDLPRGRAEFHVQASPLVDRRRRDLGHVFVARDVTEANALSRRLAAAHTQLVRQVDTIEALRADLVERANRDPLTGLHNRRYLVDRFTAMLTAAQADRATLAVVLFDVDTFKSINDEHGHLAGDAVLVALARRLAQQAPPGALVARWGGEEFFVAVLGADPQAGLALADGLRDACQQESIAVAGRVISCTVSGGVASYPASGTTMDDLFHAADAAMYEAKNAGRNLVRLHVADLAPQRSAPGS